MNRGKDLELLLQVAPDRVVSMMVDIHMTVFDLKRQISAKHGYPAELLALSMINPPAPPKEMPSEMPLSAFNLVRRTTIYVGVLDDVPAGPPPGARLPPLCGIFVKVLRSQDGDGLAASVNEKDTVVELQLRLTQSVAELKAMVQRECGVPMARQRLVFQGTEMQDKLTLVHYHVVPRSVIHLWPLSGEEE